MNKNEPAFPSPRWEGWGSPQEGMTLRDYFAAKAMQEWVGVFSPDDGAVRAYEWADAMLKARER